MTEIRKLLRLTKTTFAVSLPDKYRKTLKLGTGNYVQISLYDDKTILIRKEGTKEI